MPMIEYLIKDIKYGGVPDDQLTQNFNEEFGRAGWELVAVIPRQNQFWSFIFKRTHRG
jgi:hypothetical protein